MPDPVQADSIQTTLDALRVIRGRLYAVPASDVAAMSLPDQIAYGDNIQRVGTAILKLEATKLEQVNDTFKQRQGDLETAGVKLEKDTDHLNDSVKLIRVVSSGLTLVTNVVNLLA
jgi:hypothetical protein